VTDAALFLSHLQGDLAAEFLDLHGKARLSVHATIKSELFVQKV